MKRQIPTILVLLLNSGSVHADDFQDGIGAYQRQDYNEAVKLFHLEAVKGNPEAQFNLGLMCERGRGVLQDYKEALSLFRLSAEQKIAEAQRHFHMTV